MEKEKWPFVFVVSLSVAFAMISILVAAYLVFFRNQGQWLVEFQYDILRFFN